MSFNAIRKEHLQETLQHAPVIEKRDPNMDRWLQPDRLLPIDGKIKQWAQEVVDAARAKSDLEKARAVYNHIVSTVKYDKSGQGWGRGDSSAAVRRAHAHHATGLKLANAFGVLISS